MVNRGLAVFSGELKMFLLFHEDAANAFGISFMPVRAEDSELSRRLSFMMCGNTDLRYANGVSWRPKSLWGQAKDWLTLMTGEGDQRLKDTVQTMKQARYETWEAMSPIERELVGDAFPVIYQVTHYDPNKLYHVVSDFSGEVAYRGELRLGNELTTIFVPDSKVAMVEAYLAEKGIHGVSVHSIEALTAARFIFSWYDPNMSYKNQFRPDMRNWLKKYGPNIESQGR
jgi:hypothetical protein